MSLKNVATNVLKETDGNESIFNQHRREFGEALEKASPELYNEEISSGTTSIPESMRVPVTEEVAKTYINKELGFNESLIEICGAAYFSTDTCNFMLFEVEKVHYMIHNGEVKKIG